MNTNLRPLGLVTATAALAVLAGCQRISVSADAGPAAPSPDAAAPADAGAAPSAAAVPPAPIPYVGLTNDGTGVGYLVPIGEPATHSAQDPTYVYSAFGKLGGDSFTRDAARFDYGAVPARIAALKQKGYVVAPLPSPADLQLESHLDATPPSLVLVRGAARQPVAVHAGPDVPKFGAEILGLSADGKNVVLHVGRKPGSYANTDGLHVVLLAPLPAR